MFTTPHRTLLTRATACDATLGAVEAVSPPSLDPCEGRRPCLVSDCFPRDAGEVLLSSAG